jgi:hypothetical protein
VTRWLEIGAQDLQSAARALRKTRTVTSAAVLMLALGVGLNSAIFSVVKSIPLNQPTLAAAAGLLAVALLASSIPARRGSIRWRH